MRANGHVTHLAERTFEAEVVASKVPVLVDFWAPWCAPCRSLAPVLDELAAEYGETLKVAKLNVDEGPRLAARFRIQTIPTLILFKDGSPRGRMAGAVPRQELDRFVQELL